MTQPLPHPAWPTFIDPHRYPEAGQALRDDLPGMQAARGLQFGETALHWAAMGEIGLLTDMVHAGFDPNAIDKMGRTAMDWLSDRIWIACMAPVAGLNPSAVDRIRVRTLRQVPALYGLGGRWGSSPASRHPGLVWTRCGVWGLLSLASADPGIGLRGWGPDLASAAHAWAISVPCDHRGQALLDLLGLARKDGAPSPFVSDPLSVSEQDAKGRTPLHYALHAWSKGMIADRASRNAVKLLLEHGADIDLPDTAGITPAQVPLIAQASNARATEIARMLDRSVIEV